MSQSTRKRSRERSKSGSPAPHGVPSFHRYRRLSQTDASTPPPVVTKPARKKRKPIKVLDARPEEKYPTRIGILLTYPSQEAVKEELVSASHKRPWLYQVAKDPKAKELYILERTGETTNKKGKGIPSDVSVGYYIKWKFGKYGVDVDLILPHEISKERLAKNDINFFLIYDLLEAFHVDKSENKKDYNALMRVLNNADNIYPALDYQKLINSKITYYRWLRKHDIPIVPTRTMTAETFKKYDIDKITDKTLDSIKRSGWVRFIAKPVFGQESIDLEFFDPQKDREKFKKYLVRLFNVRNYPGVIFQNCIPNFGDGKKSPEVRMYHVGEDYKYSVIATDARVHTPFEEGGLMKNLPMSGLKEKAKEIMAELPPMIVQGKKLPRLLTRLDMGCYMEQGIAGGFQPFVNEVEFVPSLYIEDHKFLADKMLGEQMVVVTRTLITGKNDMAHLTWQD